MRYFRLVGWAIITATLIISTILPGVASAQAVETEEPVSVSCSKHNNLSRVGDKDLGYSCACTSAEPGKCSGVGEATIKCPAGFKEESIEDPNGGPIKKRCVKSASTTSSSSGSRLIEKVPGLSEFGATPEQVTSCIDEASKNASRNAPREEDRARVNRDFFASCLARKTGKDSDRIKEVLGDIDPVAAVILTAPEEKSENGEERNCGTEIPGIGWLLCGVLDAAVGVADFSWGLLEGLLHANPLKNDPKDTYYQTWKNIRDIANVILVIFFLLVIFSQITSVGISNYGIKKLLPRIIIAAVAINISYILMAIIVDLSNMLGKTLDDLIVGSLTFNLSRYGWANLFTDILTLQLTAGAGFLLLPIGVAATGAAGGVGPVLIFMLIALVPSILAVIGGLFALAFRWSLIPILAIFSPVAIAAWILPNTQPFFEKWKKMFSGMVFLYPLASVYYGGIKFVAIKIITTNTSAVLMKLIAFPLLFMGSFIILGLALKSNSIMSGMMKGVSNLAGKVTQPLVNAAGAYAGAKAAVGKEKFMAADYSSAKGNNRFTRGISSVNNMARSLFQARSRKAARLQLQAQAYAKMRENAFEDSILSDGTALGAAEGTQTAQEFRADLDEKAVRRADGTIAGLSTDQHFSIATTGAYQDALGNKIQVNEHQRRAALRRLQTTASADQAIQLAKTSTSDMSAGLRADFAELGAKTSTKVPWLGGKSIADIQAGNFKEEEAMADYINSKINASDLATMDSASLGRLFSYAQNQAENNNSSPMAALQTARDALNNDPSLISKVKSGSQAIIQNIPPTK